MNEHNDYVSKLARDYPTSLIWKMFDYAKDYPGSINTCNGEPNFDTPEHIKEAGIKAIEAGETKYGMEYGLDELRDAVAKKHIRQFGGSYDINNVMICGGGVEGIILSLMAVINPGEEVILPDPAYTCYKGQILSVGGIPVRVPLTEENGFKLTAEDLESAVTSKTKALIINYPSNPLGAVLTEEDGRKLAQVIEKHNMIVISDEVYENIIFDGRKHFSLHSLPGIKDKVIIVNSFSKTYAMTGWRLGYIVSTDKDLMENMYKMQHAILSCLPIFIMRAGVAALNGPQDCVEYMRQQYERRRDLLIDGLSDVPGMKCFRTEGSFCTFINIKELGISSWDFSKELLANARVITVAGSAFGEMGEGYLRMTFANSDENIIEATERIRKYMIKR